MKLRGDQKESVNAKTKEGAITELPKKLPNSNCATRDYHAKEARRLGGISSAKTCRLLR